MCRNGNNSDRTLQDYLKRRDARRARGSRDQSPGGVLTRTRFARLERRRHAAHAGPLPTTLKGALYEVARDPNGGPQCGFGPRLSAGEFIPETLIDEGSQFVRMAPVAR